ncbi:hypothetical protein AB0K68_25380 [Streptomyces sp. NPDC050698]
MTTVALTALSVAGPAVTPLTRIVLAVSHVVAAVLLPRAPSTRTAQSRCAVGSDRG